MQLADPRLLRSLCYLDGRWQAADDARRFAVRDPATGTTLAAVPLMAAGETAGMRVAREETFGPVAPVFRFGDEAQAVGMANDTEFGLAAYFYSRDVAPFGGVKQSGIGREGSKHRIDESLEFKYLCFSNV